MPLTIALYLWSKRRTRKGSNLIIGYAAYFDNIIIRQSQNDSWYKKEISFLCWLYFTLGLPELPLTYSRIIWWMKTIIGCIRIYYLGLIIIARATRSVNTIVWTRSSIIIWVNNISSYSRSLFWMHRMIEVGWCRRKNGTFPLVQIIKA